MDTVLIEAFGSWLIEQFADAARRKVGKRLLGSEYERALHDVGDSAIMRTACALRPGGSDEDIEFLAAVIGEVFKVAPPAAPYDKHSTMLQALQAGMTARLARLDDPGLTGVGQSSVQALGLSIERIAETLTRNVVQEILVRGARGEPLAPLADQLNHDVTHLQGQHTEDVLTRIVRELVQIRHQYSTGAGPIPQQPPHHDVQEPRRRLPPPSVPSRPAHFFPRLQLLAQAKAALLAPRKDQEGVRTVGLIGMGGVGKSVLACELARDATVKGAFPDGIMWLEIGPAPDLPALQTDLADAFGDSRPIGDVAKGRRRLNELLAGAACLIVLDNVWEPEHLRAFDLLETACALVVTSRNHDVLDHAATVCPVGLLDREEAQRLLAACAGKDPTDLPPEAGEVAHECGGLPLAVAVAGGLVADGRSWRNVRERLRRADLGRLKSRFRDYTYPDLLRALEASVHALAAEARDRYLDLVVFEGQRDIPVDIVQWLWEQAGVDELDGEDLILLLARRSLVQHDLASKSITLHDLHFDYIRHELGDKRVRARHERLAGIYLSRWLRPRPSPSTKQGTV